MKLQKNTPKIVNMLSKYKLDIAHLSAYLADSADVNFGNFHSVCKLFFKKMKISYLLNVPHTLCTTLLKRDIICL